VHGLYLLREGSATSSKSIAEARRSGADPNLLFDDWYALVRLRARQAGTHAD